MLLQIFFQPGSGLTTFPIDGANLILLLVKVLLLIGAILYLVFSFVVVRQIQVMRNTLITPLAGVIQIVGIVHLLFSIGVLLLFLLVL